MIDMQTSATIPSSATCEAALPEAPQANPTIHTAVLPLAAVILDAEVREAFLGDDLEKICGCAAHSGSAVLITTAGQGIEQREAAFLVWRKRHLAVLASACPVIGEFISGRDHLDEFLIAFEAGTIDLVQLDRAIHDQIEDQREARKALLSSQKDILREALYSHCEGVFPPTSPQILVIRGDGEIKLLKNHSLGKEWGRIGNHGFYIMPIATTDWRRFLPE